MPHMGFIAIYVDALIHLIKLIQMLFKVRVAVFPTEGVSVLYPFCKYDVENLPCPCFQ